MEAQARPLRWLLAAFLIVAIVDQVSKAILIATLEAGTAYRPDTFFYFTHQRNDGLVGGMFSGYTWLTYSAPVVATLVLIYLYRHLQPVSRLQHLAYGMVLGGALGNFIDRILYGSVIDFLQFHFYFIPFNFPWKFYPAFNVADCGIVVGVATLVLTWGWEAQSDVSGTA